MKGNARIISFFVSLFFQCFYGDKIDFSIKFLVLSLPNEATPKLT